MGMVIIAWMVVTMGMVVIAWMVVIMGMVVIAWMVVIMGMVVIEGTLRLDDVPRVEMVAPLRCVWTVVPHPVAGLRVRVKLRLRAIARKRCLDAGQRRQLSR